MTASVHRSAIGSAATTASLVFFFENPKKYWWLGAIAAIGALFVIDDVLYYLSDGKYCLLCKVLPPS